MAGFGERIVVLIDMDCFFCQVEARLQPEYQGKPLAVVQYNQWKMGGIIAVNYEARGFGVTRHMRGEEAKEKCPDVILASVPALRGKSDTSRYRSAGREVIDVLKKHCNKIERASVDEAYLDITQIVENRLAANSPSSSELMKQLSNTFVVGFSESDDNDEEQRSKGLQNWLNTSFDELDDIQAQKLAIAGVIVEEIRDDVYETTKFRCSAGISYNKILAKLACGLHKPNRQTILPSNGVPSLFKTLPVKKVRNLGGKLGDVVIDSLKCNVMSDLLRYSLMDLQKVFDEKTGFWLYNIARGIDNEPVTTRLVSKSIGVCKKFPGKQAIANAETLKSWLKDLTAEVCERLDQDLEENERRATLLTVSFHYYQDKVEISQSRSCPLNSYKPEKVADSCFNIITKSVQHPVAFIGLSAGKFIAAKGSDYFRSFFKTNPNKEETKTNSSEKLESKNPLNTSFELENNEVNSASSTKENSNSNIKENNSDSDTKENNSNSNTKENNSNSNTKENNSNSEAKENNRKIEKNYFKTDANASKTVEKESKTDENETDFKQEENEGKINKNCEDFFSNNRRTNSRDSFDRALNSQPFKQSFFMNILKKNHESTEDETNDSVPQTNEEEQNEQTNVNLNVYDTNENQLLDSENTEEIPIRQSSATLEISSKAEEKIEAEGKYSSSLYSQVSNSNWSAAKMDNVEPFVNNNSKVNVKLQEIFPDLSDIDPGVISLLPQELQQEASELLKNATKINKKAEIVAKHIKMKKIMNKQKLQEAGTSKGENTIQNFLIKANTNCEIDDSVKKCDKCHQLVPVEKQIEHNDYHIAHELQRKMNKIENTTIITQENCMKRKQTFDSSGENNSKKRGTKNQKNSTRSKSIASYFS
ncbi:DNA polymerase eta-like isoform X1 [Leptopilina heterotoma]|uniref:DNA polymerase eta-like isoform X1 n=1 Tax=Leptopilina heterotoma TaxID=63436 RepID=UPI001CA96937|nr:DNA polymerase eta-like isoform X1 [Leptopilina heterotoma]